MGLWKYNPVTGLWRLARHCTAETATQWLSIFQADEPGAYFTLARHKPKHNPLGRP